jgi:hypothetical protein
MERKRSLTKAQIKFLYELADYFNTNLNKYSLIQMILVNGNYTYTERIKLNGLRTEYINSLTL